MVLVAGGLSLTGFQCSEVEEKHFISILAISVMKLFSSLLSKEISVQVYIQIFSITDDGPCFPAGAMLEFVQMHLANLIVWL